ncbi:MAG: phage major capsid protein, partial [Oscillospiraceae bacterium]
ALSETLLSLKKRGRLLKASYEAIKHQRVDVITVALKQIGSALARTQLNDAVNCLAFGAGDPVKGVPEAEEIAAAGSSFTYDDLLKLWNAFKNFEMNVLLVSPGTFRELMGLKELRESTGGDNFISGTGMITPFGAKLFRSDAVEDDHVIGLDRRFALEMVTAGGVIVEYDKLIDTQLERAAITCTYGFSKLFPDAVKVLVRS